MRFLFIWPASGALGGVETLLARMSRWLLKQGHQVDLLVGRGDNWVQTLPKEVRCIVLEERFSELYYYYHAKRLWKSFGLPNPDVIKSFDLDSAWIAPQLAAIIGNGCRVLTGMYGSFLFKWYHAPPWLGTCSAAKLYVDNYVRAIPAESRLVCGVDQIEELEEVFQEKCFLWPIPIDTAVFNQASRKPKWGKIVSVGRIDVLKQYNLYMVDVVKELIARGHNVSWSIYGTGDKEPIVRKHIEQAGLQDVVSLNGTVPYQRFWEVLSDAYV
ncbi:MAG TPA: glycosyltransferase, partial [Bacillota bacterium]|nr:glycosyltransferase [Bacillota bacterium]